MRDSDSPGFQWVVNKSEDEHAAWRACNGLTGPRGVVRLLGGPAPARIAAAAVRSGSGADQAVAADGEPDPGGRPAARLSPSPRRHRALRGLWRRDHRQEAHRRLQLRGGRVLARGTRPGGGRAPPARRPPQHGLARRIAHDAAVAAPAARHQRPRRRHDPRLRRDPRPAQRSPHRHSRRMRSTIENNPFERCADSAPVNPSRANAVLASKARISVGARPL